MKPVSGPQVVAARMRSLLLADRQPRASLDIARWFGAMQAQDAASGHWSLGVRSHRATELDVVRAFESGDLIRTWPMRGTLHTIPGADASWLLELTGMRAMAGAGRRRAMLGLTPADAEAASAALAQALTGRRLLTRSQALDVITSAGISTEGQRGYHLLWHAAQTGITCVGPQQGTAQTFALLAQWAPTQVRFTRDEALAELLLRYVQSHGPVSLRDFVGWTGLTMTDARAASRFNEGRLIPLTSDVGELWATIECADRMADPPSAQRRVLVLPAFDEFMLGYKDRRLHLPHGGMELVVPGGNGVFRATVVVDGTVVATWTRTLRAGSVDVAVQEITRLSPELHAEMVEEFERYASFLGRQLKLQA